MNGMKFGEVHSFDDLNLILSKVDLPPAAVKTVYVDNPGGDGSWDLTEANGKVNYKDRPAKFTFSVLPEDDFEAKKTEVSNLLNGRRFKITLDKDSEYYWDGRCTVDQYESNKKMRKIVVGASVAPYKLKKEQTRVFVPFCGKNLFDKNNLPLVYGGAGCILSTLDNGVRVAWTEGQWTSYVAKFLPIQMLLGEKITLSANLEAVGGVKPCIIIGYVSADGSRRLQKVEIKKTGCVSLDIGEDAAAYDNLGIWLYSNAGADPSTVSAGAYIDYTNITIELGNTVEDRRNLIPYPYLDTTKTTSGITFTDNGDGSISIKGTATASTYFLLTNGYFGEKSISATNAESATNGEYTLSKRLFYDISNNGLVFININANTTVDEVLYPQLEKGTVATEYTPFVPFAPYVANAPKGKNLIRYPYDSGSSYSYNGITFKANEDGSVTINGTSTGFAGFVLAANDSEDKPLAFLENGTAYFLSGAGSRKADLAIYFSYNDETGATKYYGSDTLDPLVWLDSYSNHRIYIQVNKTGATFENYKIYPQFEKGTAPTDYEPYTTEVEITLSNGRKTVSPTIICTGETNFNVEGLEFTLGEGKHKVLDFSLEEGETKATLNGTGAAAIIYQEGDL